jgi:hypothetical protein
MGKRSTAFFRSFCFSGAAASLSLIVISAASAQTSCPGLDAKLCPHAVSDQNNLAATLGYFDRGLMRPVLREMGIYNPRSLQPTEQDRYVRLLGDRIGGPTHPEMLTRFERLKSSLLTQIQKDPGFIVSDPKGLAERLAALPLLSPSELLTSRRSVFDQACGPFAHTPNAIWVKPEPGHPSEFIGYCPSLILASLTVEPTPARALDALEPAILHALGRAVSSWIQVSAPARKCASMALGSRIEWSDTWSGEILTRVSASSRLVCALPENQELPSGIERVRAVWGGSRQLRTDLGCALLPDCTH